MVSGAPKLGSGARFRRNVIATAADRPGRSAEWSNPVSVFLPDWELGCLRACPELVEEFDALLLARLAWEETASSHRLC
jgi:hypothetical protein